MTEAVPPSSPSPAPSTRSWNDSELEALRSQTDPKADALVAEWFATNHEAAAHDFMAGYVYGNHPQHHAVQQAMTNFVADNVELPSWVDRSKIERACEFFGDWGLEVLLMLACSSLPDAYAAHKGVQVLQLSARLETDVKRRLFETAQVIIDVSSPGELEVGGRAHDSLRRVRLMHAGIRHLIEHDPRIDRGPDASGNHHWNPAWGKPINQEDLLGTLTAFTWAVIAPMREIGVPISDDDADAIVHTWNVAGHLLGIPDDHLPADWASTVDVAEKIRRRNYGHSAAGVAMEQGLIEFMHEIVPFKLFDGFPATLSRHVMGDRVADMIEVPAMNWTRVFLRPLGIVNHRYAGFLHRFAIRKLMARSGHRVIDLFEEVERGGGRPPFEIPEHLSLQWDRRRRSRTSA